MILSDQPSVDIGVLQFAKLTIAERVVLMEKVEQLQADADNLKESLQGSTLDNFVSCYQSTIATIGYLDSLVRSKAIETAVAMYRGGK